MSDVNIMDDSENRASQGERESKVTPTVVFLKTIWVYHPNTGFILSLPSEILPGEVLLNIELKCKNWFLCDLEVRGGLEPKEKH